MQDANPQVLWTVLAEERPAARVTSGCFHSSIPQSDAGPVGTRKTLLFVILQSGAEILLAFFKHDGGKSIWKWKAKGSHFS